MPGKPRGTDTTWHVRHTHSHPVRMQWHRVATLTDNLATTACGLTYTYPTANVVFVQTITNQRSQFMCEEGCYDGNR